MRFGPGRCERTTAAHTIIISTASIASLILATQSHAQTTRPETVVRAIVSIERGCPVTQALDEQQRAAQPARLGPILGALVAGVAGNLVTSGVNAVGTALEEASQEKAIVAEGVSSFTAYLVDNGGKPTDKWRAVPDLEVEVLPEGAPGSVADGAPSETAARCLVLIVPASTAAKGGKAQSSPPELTGAAIANDFSATGIKNLRASNAAGRLKALGVTTSPALYLEAELVGASDGLVIQPVLIRYATRLPGAPKGAAATELHVSFAVPGAADTTDIGTLYALARISLPKMAPAAEGGGAANATVFTRMALRSNASVVLPLRPTTGVVDSTLTARNAVVASIDTKNAEIAQLREALRIAQRKLDQNKEASKTQELTNGVSDATLALKVANEDKAALLRRAKGEPLMAGSTNIKARFIVIEDANKFGLALAKALKAQAEATGTAVAERLKPKPEWTAQDTAFVEAESGVRAAERAVDEAIAAGETSKVPGLQEAAIKAKAKANEAAVAAGRQPPYAIL